MNATEVVAVTERIKAILAGKPPQFQAAVLADLLAMWLAGHDVPGEPEETQQLRAHLLAEHCWIVRQLVPLNAQQIGTTP